MDTLPTSIVPHTAREAAAPAPEEAFVDAWLDRTGPSSGFERRLRLLARAVVALCEDAARSLGDLTVDTIIARVMEIAGRRFPSVVPHRLPVHPIAGLAALRVWATAQPASELVPVSRFVLVELLTDLGGLTHELRTPALYARIAAVASDEPDARAAT